MAEKYSVSIYYTYGKGDGEELGERYIVDNDSTETRREIAEDIYFDDEYDLQDFVDGRSNSFSFDSHGGDWDDPAGGFVVIQSKSSLIKSIEDEAQREIDEVENLFKLK